MKDHDRRIQKRCIKCREWKDRAGPNHKFGQHPSSSDGLQSICFDCKNKANVAARKKNVVARVRHHMSTRCLDQLGATAPIGFTKDMEEHLGYRIRTLCRSLRIRLVEREGRGRKLRDALNEGYHIDHIRPLSSYRVIVADSEDEDSVNWEVFRECWAINNLEAIPAEENLAKGARF